MSTKRSIIKNSNRVNSAWTRNLYQLNSEPRIEPSNIVKNEQKIIEKLESIENLLTLIISQHQHLEPHPQPQYDYFT